jgi:hypothetical protein
MVEPIAPIAPAIAVPPVQPAQNSTPAASVTGTGGTANVNFLNEFEQAAALQNLGQTSTNQASILDTSEGTDNSLLDNAILTNLSPQALSALNEVNTSTITTASVGGNLTPAQLEEITTLENDAQMLNTTETTTFSSDVSLLDSASTVNLSPQAVDILNGSGTSITVGNTLTTAQLQQIAGILTPFVNQPLTQDTLTQMQNALTAAGFNPTQLSLQNIFLSQNFLAELMPVSSPDAEQLALNETITTELLDA